MVKGCAVNTYLSVYHAYIQYSFVLEGKFLAKEVRISKKNKIYKKDLVKSSRLNGNEFVEHEPFQAHAFKCVSSRGKLIVFSKGLRGGKNYERDTFRLLKPLIK